MENRLEYKSDSHKIRMTGFTHIGICKKVKNSIKKIVNPIFAKITLKDGLLRAGETAGILLLLFIGPRSIRCHKYAKWLENMIMYVLNLMLL